MNQKQKKSIKDHVKKGNNSTTLRKQLQLTIVPADQETAYNVIKGLLLELGISTGPREVDKNISEAAGILKTELKLQNLLTRKPAEKLETKAALDTSVISFTDPVQQESYNNDLLYFMGELTQGGNLKSIRYKVAKCSIGLAVAYEPIVADFFRSGKDMVTSDETLSERELRELASSSLKTLALGKAKESTRYLASGRMKLECTREGSDELLSFYIVSCGQNCDEKLTNVGNEYHGEAFIYGAFLATLNILDLSGFKSTVATIDYKASTSQSTACKSCSILIPTLTDKMKGIDGITQVIDNY